MRHFLLSGPVAALAFGMGVTASPAGLIPATGSTRRLTTSLIGTLRGAVAMTAITPAANEYSGAATGAEIASSGEVHWQFGQWGIDADVRFVKYSASNVATVGAAGRGIGTGLAVGTGVAPAFPPAGQLSTASVALAPSSVGAGSLQPACAGTPFGNEPCHPPAALRLPDAGLLCNPATGSPAGGKS